MGTQGSAGPRLQPEQVLRYSRHLLLPQVGTTGQQRLLDARVLIVGAGGLAAPVLHYLAAAGVGSLTVVDDDEVELSNLQRQVIHRTRDVGAPKVESAARAVSDINPDVEVHPVFARVDSDNVVPLVAAADVVVDATDNFTTRFLLNDACVLLGVPLVWAAINRFDGQLTVWSPGAGPCLRCLFPVQPDPSAVPSCADAGVLGVLPGLMGTAQAGEVLKLVLGIGEPLIGRLAVFDALSFDWSMLPLAADPQCAVCRADASVQFIAAEPVAMCTTEQVEVIGAAAVAQGLQAGKVRLLDVRTAAEREIARVDGAEWLPLDELRAGGMPDDDGRVIVAMCKSGTRSQEAAALLVERGRSASSLDGGILAWSQQVDPSVPLY
ncbi:molybdopterin-synthase adenylyltransferase MoeB [Yimella sp. cx-573]|nr:molybdopterin-synthase adenylyltransferase MoeB [Yimella sp. cx-573]